MSLTTLLFQRRSIRKFTADAVTEQDVKELKRAALSAPTSKNGHPWQFVFVTNADVIRQLSQCKDAGAQFLETAPLAVVVMADPEKSDVWIEDASIAAAFIQLQAESLGLGSCWCQVRKRGFGDGRNAEEIVRNIVGAPDTLAVECIIGIGYREKPRSAYSDDRLLWDQIRDL